MNQHSLFAATLSEAIEETVNQLGGLKRVGLTLWPAKSAESAQSSLRDCLDPKRRACLSLDEIDHIFRMARDANVLTVWKYQADKFDLEIRPIDPTDKKAELQREVIQSVERLEILIAQLRGMK